MRKAVAYCSVSPNGQGRSGLGPEAQEGLASDHSGREGLDIILVFGEAETGTRKRRRPQLEEAVRLSRQERALLLFAKVDRLARNVYFLSGVMETGVDFEACDPPQADRFTVHKLGATAEREANSFQRGLVMRCVPLRLGMYG